MKHYLFLVTVMTLVVSCTYNRNEGCHLDKLNLNGNVKKIETIVQTTMPLTELYYGSIDPSKSISMFGGNFVFDFDNHGYLKKTTGYGIDGKVLFVSDYFSQSQEPNLAPSVISVSAKQQIDRVKTISESDGKVVNAQYYSGSELIWNQYVTYNDKKDVVSIVKEYLPLSIKSDLLNIQYADTTKYEYSSLDEHGNWTVAKVYYTGVLPKHKHEYTVIRQITYYGDSKKSPLIKQLDSVNEEEMHYESSEFDNITIGKYGKMKIPHYMMLQSDDYISLVNDYSPRAIDYIFMSEYDNSDAYASFSVSRNYVGKGNVFDEVLTNELPYIKALDEELKKLNVLIMEQGGTYILKWLPYSCVNISGRKALKLSYYRYGNGSPIPVYCENYLVPMDDGYILSIVYGFQSNLDNKFRVDFNKAVNSIMFK